MVKEMIHRNSGPELHSHVCGPRCLGPLTFHREAVGSLVTLSQGGRRADRVGGSFRHGLVFSSRPVRVRERVRLRVGRCRLAWHGALRVGFTSVPPPDRALPSLAIPDLTDTAGHWAAPVPEWCCLEGSELDFWVSFGGNVYFRRNDGRQYKLMEGLDLSQPLWAMMDIYGQTCSVLLLGSERRDILCTRKSCPASPGLGDDSYFNLEPRVSNACRCSERRRRLRDDGRSCPANRQTADLVCVEDCAVCLNQEASVTLQCGHQCLCFQCADRVIRDFGRCPLCRRNI